MKTAVQIFIFLLKVLVKYEKSSIVFLKKKTKPDTPRVHDIPFYQDGLI